ncbi:MAG: aminoacyl-tRNA hydrolase [Rickettsiales bacterium]|jgi:PTH1 family peptidyl-tRNA hydrolase|nr:aminoacyl-tRNA hydrolase [Rickettsiales bacterium]
MQENKPILIIGLGNPGNQYKNTRHNAGFIAVEHLASDDAVWKKEKNALVSKRDKFIFAMPQTFMNLSGAAALALMTFYKIPLENLVVIHDDIDLKIGDIREKRGGGSAGHNGIKSIAGAVGNDFHRIRVGVGRPENNLINVSDWVLGKFSAIELKQIADVIKQIQLP